MKNILTIPILILSIGFIFQTSCIKECEKNYWFEIPFTVSLTSDTIQVGDTIWLESEYDFSLTDLNSNTNVEVDSFEMLIELLVGNLDSLGKDATDYFDFWAEEGQNE